MRASNCDSYTNRRSAEADITPDFISLIATVRRGCYCTPRYTAPIPPVAINFLMRDLPICLGMREGEPAEGR